MSKKIRSTTLGPHKIEIQLTDLRDKCKRGEADLREFKIYIEPDQPPSARLETLVHECLHFAQWYAGAEQSEAKVQATAILLTQMLVPFLRPV